MAADQAPLMKDSRIRAAVGELEGLIRERYPEATFAVGPAEDEPGAIHVTATVDVDDPDEVVDLVIERMLAFQIDEGLPVFVIPIRTPERLTTMLAQRAADPLLDHALGFSSPATD